jgi:sugar O-acyltransferase (sialic acid O-acetyltransferase NeuD family)
MYLFGASGHGKVIMDILLAMRETFHGFIDENRSLIEVSGVPVIHDPTFLIPTDRMIISIGNNHIRKELSKKWNVQYAIAIHPSAIVSNSVEIGEGTVVMHGAIIQADTKIGKHSIVNTAASVDHDCDIADFVHIAPGSRLCGGVSVGANTLLGTGTIVIPGIRIGANCIIGAGSVIVTDIPDNSKVYGNPGKII